MVTDGPTSEMELGLERDVDHWGVSKHRGLLGCNARSDRSGPSGPIQCSEAPACLLVVKNV